MPPFSVIDAHKLESIPSQEFTCGKELHQLLEKNLVAAIGVKLVVACEYPVPNGRIDSRGIDERRSPCHSSIAYYTIISTFATIYPQKKRLEHFESC